MNSGAIPIAAILSFLQELFDEGPFHIKGLSNVHFSLLCRFQWFVARCTSVGYWFSKRNTVPQADLVVFIPTMGSPPGAGGSQ